VNRQPMTKEKILHHARTMDGFKVSEGTEELTLKLVSELIQSNKIRVAMRFENGHGCKLIAV